jgi:MoaA/NifB/PqqE/SkfB family radical SAM enzyme
MMILATMIHWLMQLTFTSDEIVGTIDCDHYKDNFVDLYLALKALHQPAFESNQKIVIKLTNDFYKDSHGLILQSLQTIINHIDISNCFICLVTTNNKIHEEYRYVHKTYSTDPTTFKIQSIAGNFERLPAGDIRPYTKTNSVNHRSEEISKLTKAQRDLLFKNKNFCIIPWTSLYIHTKNGVAPCCAWNGESIGDCSKDSLKDIWNDKPYQNLRKRMLNDLPSDGCKQCMRAEKLGKESFRTSMNTTFAKHVDLVEQNITPEYNLKFIDSRFNNLCNLSCRSCVHGSSSSWHAPAVAVGLIDKSTPVFLKAGRNNTDLYDQIVEQLDNIDRIYFAGGEPLMMPENYKILAELNLRHRHDIQLIYNTNMTRSHLKGHSIFDAWKNFKNISIGASLDAEGERGAYLRTGTVWQDVLDFRREMLDQRPDIDFYISSTTSLINVLHVPDFHRSWTEKGLIKPEQFRIQTLHWPEWMRVETAPPALRVQIREKINNHLEWLRPLDNEGRATQGFESILTQLDTTIAFDSKDFWQNILPLDKYYKANLLDSFPELVDLPK